MNDFQMYNEGKKEEQAQEDIKLCEHAYGENGCAMMDEELPCSAYPEDSEC